MSLRAPMTPEEAEVEMAIQEWMRLGLVGRWRCEVCDDWVPFILAEMTEVESRVQHVAVHQ